MLDYFILGCGTSTTAAYTLYCHLSFYKDLKKTIIKKQAENKDRNRTLEDIFRKDGVYTVSGVYPRGAIGNFFLKPTIHITKTLLKQGRYDQLAEEYARKKGISQKN